MAKSVPAGGVRVDRVDDVWIVTLTGEHDLANVAELRSTLDSLYAPDSQPLSRPTLVVVDLTQAEFFDSGVIGVLFRAHTATRHDPDARLAVVVDAPDSFAAHVLRVLGLTRVVPTYTSRERAVAALSQDVAREG